MYNNCDKANKLHVPTLFIHGNRDNIIPYIHGRILAKLIPKEYLYKFITINLANHNNIFKKCKEKTFEKIVSFIEFCNTNKKTKVENYQDAEVNFNYLNRDVSNNSFTKEINSKFESQKNYFIPKDTEFFFERESKFENDKVGGEKKKESSLRVNSILNSNNDFMNTMKSKNNGKNYFNNNIDNKTTEMVYLKTSSNLTKNNMENEKKNIKALFENSFDINLEYNDNSRSIVNCYSK